MNRSALNTVSLGSGNSLPWVTAVAQQILRLTSAVSVGLTKYGAAAGTLALDGVLRVTRRVAAGSNTISVALVGSLPIRVWVQVKAIISSLLRMAVSIAAHREVPLVANNDCTLTGSVTVHHLIAVHAQGGTTLGMTGSASGADLYTGPAAEERTTTIVEIKTQETASVNIGGA